MYHATFQCKFFYHLKLENLVLGETKSGKSTGKLTLVGGRDLLARNGLVERRRATDKDLDVLLRGLEEVLLKVLLGDETSLALPAGGGLVKEEVELELLGVLGGNGLKLVLEQNVRLGHVTVEQANLGLVSGILLDGVDELVKRGDTTATTNEADLLVEVGLVGVLGDGSLEGNSIIEVEAEDVVTKLAGLVSLNQELERTGGLEVRDGSVRADHVGALLGDKSGEQAGSVSQAENIVCGELKGELLDVGGNVLDISKLFALALGVIQLALRLVLTLKSTQSPVKADSRAILEEVE